MRSCLPAVFLPLLICLTSIATGDESKSAPTPSTPQPKSVPPDHPERAKKGLALFKSSVRATLTKHCLDCHGGKSTKGDFDLSSREVLLASGFVTDSADDSYLIALITHAAEPHMPFKAPKLSDAEIEQIRQWINLGAPYDSPLAEKATGPKPEMQVKDSDREFWAFRPLQKVTVPTPADAAWCRTPIDRFIRTRQETE